MGRVSVWDDHEVVVMDGGGRCRAVNVHMATELYETCLTVSVVCPLHHNRKVVSQEDGAIASPRRALEQGSCILVLALTLCPLLVTKLTVGTQ